MYLSALLRWYTGHSRPIDALRLLQAPTCFIHFSPPTRPTSSTAPLPHNARLLPLVSLSRAEPPSLRANINHYHPLSLTHSPLGLG